MRRRRPLKKTPSPVSSNGKMIAAVRGAMLAGLKPAGLRRASSAAVLVIVRVVVAVPPAVRVGELLKVQPASAGRPEQLSATCPAKVPTEARAIL